MHHHHTIHIAILLQLLSLLLLNVLQLQPVNAATDQPFSIGKLALIAISGGEGMQQDGSDDWRVLAADGLKPDAIHDKDIDVVNNAYDKRMAELNAELPRTNDANRKTYKEVKAMMVSARKRLRNVVKGRELAEKVNKEKERFEKDKKDATNPDKDELSHHLVVMNYGDTKDSVKDVKQNLLRSRKYNEKALWKRRTEMQALLDTKNFAYLPDGTTPDIKKEVTEAHNHVNGAYNDLKKYAIVNEILRANIRNQRDRQTALGYNQPGMATAPAAMGQQQQRGTIQREQQQRAFQEMGTRFRDRMKSLNQLLARYNAEQITDIDDQQKLQDIQKAEDKLFKMYQEEVFLHAMPSSTAETQGRGRNRPQQQGMGGPTGGGGRGGGAINNPVAQQMARSQPGDLAHNCMDSIQYCFDTRFRGGMDYWCRTTCQQLGQDGKDVGTNCAEMKQLGMCEQQENRFVLSKLCAATCRR